MSMTVEPLWRGAEWNFDMLRRAYDAIERIAVKELGLKVRTNRIEVISAEQMLDAYAATGLPLMYRHWSFGKRFALHQRLYSMGAQGLAYEVVINADPIVSYVMEENTASMQALVIAHAAFGHNHFFTNNRLFLDNTDAAGILDYLEFARGYVLRCEERHGEAEVERLLDAAHALMGQAGQRAPRRPPDLAGEERREMERREYDALRSADIWRTVPQRPGAPPDRMEEARRRALLGLPQENLLYFLEKWAPRLRPWQREILRIVRNLAQYFRPQGLTKVMNEGCATYVHWRIMNRLNELGLTDESAHLEFLHNHTNVVLQPGFDDPRYSGLNPYALGFAMMQDIARIARDPTEEDREWFPDIAGTGDEMAVLKEAWASHRDESFIGQYLSPRLMRQMRLFQLVDDPSDPDLRVEAIHDERGWRRLRRALALQHDPSRQEPDIVVQDVDLAGDRRLVVHHHVLNRQLLDEAETRQTLQHLADLWGYGVVLREVDGPGGATLREHAATPLRPFG